MLPLVAVTRSVILDAQWLRLELECGHSVRRRRKFRWIYNPLRTSREDPFPKKVRCADCGGAEE
jgi:hypothetical protein